MSDRPPEDLLDRHEAFLACGQTDRPLVGLWLGGYFPTDQFPVGAAMWADGQSISPDQVRLAPFKVDYERLYQLHHDATDDFFYVGSAYWGIPWLEAIAGCSVRTGRTSCWTQACLSDIQEGLSVDLDANPWMNCLL